MGWRRRGALVDALSGVGLSAQVVDVPARSGADIEVRVPGGGSVLIEVKFRSLASADALPC